MQAQRERLKMVPIRTLHRFPARHLGLPRLHVRLGRWAGALPVGIPSVALQPGLGVLERLVGLP
jgi:hypothetical protein